MEKVFQIIACLSFVPFIYAVCIFIKGYIESKSDTRTEPVIIPRKKVRILLLIGIVLLCIGGIGAFICRHFFEI